MYCYNLYLRIRRLLESGEVQEPDLRRAMEEFAKCIDDTYSLDRSFHNAMVRMLISYLKETTGLDVDIALRRMIDNEYRLKTRNIKISEIINALLQYAKENPKSDFVREIYRTKITFSDVLEQIRFFVANSLYYIYGRAIEPYRIRRREKQLQLGGEEGAGQLLQLIRSLGARAGRRLTRGIGRGGGTRRGGRGARPSRTSP